MSEMWGIPSPYKSGAQNHLFRRFRNFRAILTAYIFEMKHNIPVHKRASALKLQGVSYIVSKLHELWFTDVFRLELSFLPPSVNSAFQFIVRLLRCRSANGTQPNFAKRWKVNRASKSGKSAVKQLESTLLKKTGDQKTLAFVRFFRRLRGLMANIC